MFFKIKSLLFLFLLSFNIAQAQEFDFYYSVNCPHCARVEPYLENIEKTNKNLKINKFEIYYSRDKAIELMKKFEKHNIPQDKQGIPALFVDEDYYIGDKDIINFLENIKNKSETGSIKNQNISKEKGIKFNPLSANDIEINNTNTVDTANSDRIIKANNNTNNTNNEFDKITSEKLDDKVQQKNVNSSEKINNLKDGLTNSDKEIKKENKKTKLSLIAIASAALVDSINPCAIAVLVILLAALLVQKERKKALLSGLAFTLSVFIAYFLLGIGLIYTIGISGLSGLLYNAIGILAIVIGLANLKDFFWYGKGGFVMEIPLSWRPKLKKLLGSVTSPFGAFLMGFVIMLFELPCTGGPYFFVIGLLSQDLEWIKIIPTLLYYNFVFVLPLIFLTFAIYGGLYSVEQTNTWKDKNIRILHLISGIIMLALGIWIFIG